MNRSLGRVPDGDCALATVAAAVDLGALDASALLALRATLLAPGTRLRGATDAPSR